MAYVNERLSDNQSESYLCCITHQEVALLSQDEVVRRT